MRRLSQKRQDILSTAERLFYEYGFRGIGLKQIIQEANVATMTLYNHFASKDNLVEAVLKQRESRYWHYLDTYVENNHTNLLFLQSKHIVSGLMIILIRVICL